ncbi:hypothetical protein L4D76_27395 [Photobacterium sagamiensis]|uniref:hypothetical protein n=1 Tax=Photobacterium sagamiensis TaxID=2910241 RepID=UPI003D0FC754
MTKLLKIKGESMVADKDTYIRALLHLRDKSKLRNTKYLAMLRAQYSSENQTITASRLAKAVGFKNFNATNLQYGILAHEIADFIEYMPPKSSNGEPMWFLALSSGNDASDDTLDGHYEFIMRPELVAALEEMKWV